MLDSGIAFFSGCFVRLGKAEKHGVVIAWPEETDVLHRSSRLEETRGHSEIGDTRIY